MLRTILLALYLALAPVSAVAQEPPQGPSPAAEGAADAESEAAAEAKAIAAAREAFEKTITRRSGAVGVAGDRATLTVPAGYYYLDRADAKRVLEEAWGNPPSDSAEGMLFPEKFSAVDSDSWGVVISFEETGYVSDADAEKINYDDLLRDMQKEQKELNPELIKENYPPIEIVGWATPPRYDSRTHRIYWAKDLIFGSDNVHTLNYDMRILGRHGVLQLKFVAAMDDLKTIEEASAAVLASPEFKPGFRYEEFDPRTDAKADFGIAGLVAGGAAGGLLLAKKTGLIGIALLFLKKAWVLVAAALAGGGAFLRNLFGGKGRKEARAQALSTDFFDKQRSGPPPGDPPLSG